METLFVILFVFFAVVFYLIHQSDVSHYKREKRKESFIKSDDVSIYAKKKVNSNFYTTIKVTKTKIERTTRHPSDVMPNDVLYLNLSTDSFKEDVDKARCDNNDPNTETMSVVWSWGGSTYKRVFHYSSGVFRNFNLLNPHIKIKKEGEYLPILTSTAYGFRKRKK